jgi:micrococcal nuclease
MYRPGKKAISITAVLVTLISAWPASQFLLSEDSGITDYSPTDYVGRVIDGDTIVLENGERVRLLGIDTPETGQYYYKEAREYVEKMVLHKNVRLESGPEDRDKYGRLLRYVFAGSTFVNLELVKKGYASALIYSEDERYSDILVNAESDARAFRTGIWSIDVPNPFCTGIFRFHYNAKGNDNHNLNDEYVVFRNKCTHPVKLGGWMLKDAANKTYTFRDFTLENKTKVSLHTGSGTDNQTDLYWGQKTAVWNNNGDRLRMWDSDGNLMLDYSY